MFGSCTLGCIAEDAADKQQRDNSVMPQHCPLGGVSYAAVLPDEQVPDRWIFLFHHIANLDFLNKHILSSEESARKILNIHLGSNTPQISYPVRMSAKAGFRRQWGLRGGGHASYIGDQTLVCLKHVGASAQSLVGVLVPIRSHPSDLEDTASFRMQSNAQSLIRNTRKVDATLFDWLGWVQAPVGLTHVEVTWWEFAALAKQPSTHGGEDDYDHMGIPTFSLPILQTNVDLIMEAALVHGKDFAAEWLGGQQHD